MHLQWILDTHVLLNGVIPLVLILIYRSLLTWKKPLHRSKNMICWAQNWCFRTLNIQPMGQWLSAIYSSVNMGNASSAICKLPYPLHYLTLLRTNCMAILDDNTMLTAFVVTNVIPNSIFSLNAPVNKMEEIMVAIMVAHLGLTAIIILLLSPILLPNKIQIQTQTQILLETLQHNPSGSTFIQMNSIRS